MKKLFKIFVLLCIIYFGILLIQRKMTSGHHISYIVNTQNEKFEIEETYQKNKNNQAGYLLTIRVNDAVFPIPIALEKKNKKLVDDVYYFENKEYVCIYPVGKNLKLDVLCENKETIYPYHNIRGVDLEIDQFVLSLENYDSAVFMDNRSILKTDAGISIYNHVISDHMIGMETYKGLYVLDASNLLRKKNLFTSDIYQKSVKIFDKQYYIVGDYNQNYEFHEFSVVNMQNMKVSKIISNKAISLDSYIQGVVDNSLYLLDRTNKRQYKIDLSSKTVKKIGDTDLGVQMYLDGKWSTMTMYEVLRGDTYFKNTILPEEIDPTLYEAYQQVGKYYYLYQKEENGYAVYRIQEESPEIRYYITTLSDTYQVGYIGDYFYWKEKDSIYYYHDSIGSRIVIKNPEMEFNSDLQFGIYIK